MSGAYRPVFRDHERLHSKLATLLQICQQINSERDLGILLDLVTREAAQLLEADRASIFLFDERKEQFWSKVALGSDEVLRFDAHAGIAGIAASTGQIVNVADAYTDPRFNRAIDARTGYRTRTMLAVPLRKLDGEIIGVFEALNRSSGVFSAQDEEIAKSLAAQVANAIQTAQSVNVLTRSHDELAKENVHLRREVEKRYAQRPLVGGSPSIQKILRLIDQIRDSSVNVLINGESGTGKELAARAIHYSSPRARRPFVALNCAALPETLVESELFGIERGVATGVQPRTGQFQAADGGTLFLDEIADLSLTAQAKILRVLQEHVLQRVGGRSEIRVDVRVIAASNKDLETEIRKGAFREDLYYRLKVVHIRMPALREIREDIPELANVFLAEACREMNKGAFEFSAGAMERLRMASWPGNVRQLQNEVRRLVVCAKGPRITEDDLGESLATSLTNATAPLASAGSLKTATEQLERQMIVEALEHAGNNQSAARALGLSRQGLLNKMKRYGLVD